MLLREYAITPDVFDETSYPHSSTCELALQNLKAVLLTEGLVRDLRRGEWRRVFAENARPWHSRGKELLKKLVGQNRLVSCDPRLAVAPTDDAEWCREALSSHDDRALTGGIIVTEAVKTDFPDEDLVARIDRLSSAPWWATRSSSVRLRRDMGEYLEQLAPVLRCANSLMFIDPHLDPARRGYRDFGQLLQAAGDRPTAPTIEIHRVAWVGSSRDKRPQCDRLEESFRKKLTDLSKANGLRVEVFLWDDFHDRYLISDLVGISLPNGFDTTTNPNSITRWTRLGREDRDDVQREFDPAKEHHSLQHRFVIPNG